MTAVDIQRAEALFVSGLDPAERPDGARIRNAVRDELVVGDCAGRMAQLYGDHETESARRMTWCLREVREVFALARA